MNPAVHSWRVTQRFATKIRKEGACWLWTASLDSSGYGMLRVAGKLHKAHRVSYLMFRGNIPEGLCLDHLCRKRACVNPDHLEPVPPRVNTARGHSGKAEREMTHCRRGHAFTPENTQIQKSPYGRKWQRRCGACRRLRYAERVAAR